MHTPSEPSLLTSREKGGEQIKNSTQKHNNGSYTHLQMEHISLERRTRAKKIRS